MQILRSIMRLRARPNVERRSPIAYTGSVMRIVGICGTAALLASLLLGGCVNDVAVQPEGTNLLWRLVQYPHRNQINCIAIDPEGRIFLGAYDLEPNITFAEYALYISSDNGETWTKMHFGPLEIASLAIDSEGRIFAAGFYKRIMRSLNHGASWETLTDTLRTSYPRRLVIDASDNLYLPTDTSGIYFSSDHGDSWTQIGEGIRAAGTLISLDVNSRGCLFAIAGGNLYRSCDHGESWTQMTNVPWTVLYRQVAIDSKDRIFINDRYSLYRSTDDGETWTATSVPPDRPVYKISIDGRDRFYALCYFSVFVSNDGGDSWAAVMSISWNQVDFIAVNGAGDIFVAGSWGLSRSIDGGASWEMLGFSYYEPIAIAIDGSGFFYIGLECGGVYRSTGDLASWERFNGGLPAVWLYCFASANDSTIVAGTSDGLYVSPTNRPAWSRAGLAGRRIEGVFPFPGDSIVVFSNDIILSTDGGTSWSQLGLDDYEMRGLVKTGDGSLLAGASFGGVFRYTGEGILWDQMNDGLGDLHVNALAVTGGGDVLAGTDAGVFISSNGGASWRRFSKERIQITAVLVVGEDIFFGTEEGVLWTRTDGSALSHQNDGIPSSDLGAIISIAADPDKYLYLFTASGTFKSEQSTKELSPAGL
jgi:photosystem II stability/assembly factor-like uncharacterized protein